MRIIHTGGFHLDERKEARQVIFSNLVVAYKIIIEEMKDMGIDFENKQSVVCWQGDHFALPSLTAFRCSRMSFWPLKTLT